MTSQRHGSFVRRWVLTARSGVLLVLASRRGPSAASLVLLLVVGLAGRRAEAPGLSERDRRRVTICEHTSCGQSPQGVAERRAPGIVARTIAAGGRGRPPYVVWTSRPHTVEALATVSSRRRGRRRRSAAEARRQRCRRNQEEPTALLRQPPPIVRWRHRPRTDHRRQPKQRRRREALRREYRQQCALGDGCSRAAGCYTLHYDRSSTWVRMCSSWWLMSTMFMRSDSWKPPGQPTG